LYHLCQLFTWKEIIIPSEETNIRRILYYIKLINDFRRYILDIYEMVYFIEEMNWFVKPDFFNILIRT